ncbi:hypothetical protein FQA39_LY13423 [Lamprigera yunnana]|nr:hypothetical protein FQA39_LY13423 [Lamprigera yunnana]
MNSRARGILQLSAKHNAKLYSDENGSSSDPFLGDSYNDLMFIPSNSSCNLTDDSDCEIPHKQIMRSPSSQNINSSGPSHAFQSKQRMSLSESDKEVELQNNDQGCEIRQEIETVQRVEEFDVEGDVGEAKDGNPIQTLCDLSQSIWGPPNGNHLQFEENCVGGVNPEWHAALRCIMSCQSKRILELAAQKLKEHVPKHSNEKEAGPSNLSSHLQKQYESEEEYNDPFSSDDSIKDKTFTAASAEISDSHGSSRSESEELDSDSDTTDESVDINSSRS